jgi:hypothetical protein
MILRVKSEKLKPKLSDFSCHFEIATHPSGSRNDRLIKQIQEKSLNLGKK